MLFFSYDMGCLKPADSFVLCNNGITRGHNLKLFTPQCSLDVRKYSFVYWVIDIWNSLSSGIVNACSISVFKHKLESLSVDFTPLCGCGVHLDLCVSLLHMLIFSFVGNASVSFGTCMSRLLFGFGPTADSMLLCTTSLNEAHYCAVLGQYC